MLLHFGMSIWERDKVWVLVDAEYLCMGLWRVRLLTCALNSQTCRELYQPHLVSQAL